MPKEIDRRTFLRRAVVGATGMTAAGILATAENDAILIAGKVIGATLSHPRRTFDTVELWTQPSPFYKSSPFLDTRFTYPDNSSRGLIFVAFGDSNMVGAEGRDRANSPIKLFAQGASARLGIKDRDFNFADSGATTKMVMKEQLYSEDAKKVFSAAKFCDVWINAGGNDLASVATTRNDLMEAESLGDNLANPDILFKYASRVIENLDYFKKNFSELLTALYSQYGDKILHLVIMSAPDFSKAPGITTQKIENKSLTIPLNSPDIRRMIHNISIRMNNSMFDAAMSLHRETGIKIIGIDTFPDSEFANDQHLTRNAVKAIAKEALGRIEVDA